MLNLFLNHALSLSNSYFCLFTFVHPLLNMLSSEESSDYWLNKKKYKPDSNVRRIKIASDALDIPILTALKHKIKILLLLTPLFKFFESVFIK